MRARRLGVHLVQRKPGRPAAQRRLVGGKRRALLFVGKGRPALGGDFGTPGGAGGVQLRDRLGAEQLHRPAQGRGMGELRLGLGGRGHGGRQGQQATRRPRHRGRLAGRGGLGAGGSQDAAKQTRGLLVAAGRQMGLGLGERRPGGHGARRLVGRLGGVRREGGGGGVLRVVQAEAQPALPPRAGLPAQRFGAGHLPAVQRQQGPRKRQPRPKPQRPGALQRHLGAQPGAQRARQRRQHVGGRVRRLAKQAHVRHQQPQPAALVGRGHRPHGKARLPGFVLDEAGDTQALGQGAHAHVVEAVRLPGDLAGQRDEGRVWHPQIQAPQAGAAPAEARGPARQIEGKGQMVEPQRQLGKLRPADCRVGAANKAVPMGKAQRQAQPLRRLVRGRVGRRLRRRWA